MHTLPDTQETTSPQFRRTLGRAFQSLLRVVPRPRITIIGGGHGISAVLSVLKPMEFSLTAIVAVSDDGGSSGVLRDAFGMAPPGDLRRCLLALSDAPETLRELFDYRFAKTAGAGLANHSFGNLAMAALFEQAGGDLMQSLALCSRLLQVQGTVLPATTAPVHLKATLRNGRVVVGETAIAIAGTGIHRVSLLPEVVAPAPGVLEAIADADMVLIGPGSLYTSVIPPLLVSGVAAALRARTGRTVYLCNPCTQPGETDGYRASDHVRALLDHIGEGTIRKAMVNIETGDSLPLLDNLVEADGDRITAFGLAWVPGNLIDLMAVNA